MAPTLGIGDLVSRPVVDAFAGPGGAEVDQVGMVVGLVSHEGDEAYMGPDGSFAPDGVRVVWFASVSDPLAVDELTPVEGGRGPSPAPEPVEAEPLPSTATAAPPAGPTDAPPAGPTSPMSPTPTSPARTSRRRA